MAHNKLLLIHDVNDLGRSGDIVSVRPGFARNFLLPKKLAVIADARAIKMQEKLREERLKKAEADKAESEKLAASIVDLVIETAVKVDHDGRMYGSVNVGDIVELVLAQSGISLEKRFIHLKHPIKEIGVFEVPVKLKEGVISKVTIKVLPEESQG